MKLVHKIEIKNLLGDDPKYKKEWLGKRSGLNDIKDPLISEKKKGLFDKMETGIDKLKRSSLAGETIRIYKKNDYEFSPEEKISPRKIEKIPTVTSEKIDWKKEGSDEEMVFQVNFANSTYGGATFGRGFVQEEIKNVLSTTASIYNFRISNKRSFIIVEAN